MKTILNYINDESGAAAAEYALILGVVATGIVLALGTLSGDIAAAINLIAGKL